MGNITAIYPGRRLKKKEVLRLFHEVNEQRFNGLFTIARHPRFKKTICFTIEGLGDGPHRWKNAYFEFDIGDTSEITSKWASPLWLQFLYVVFKHEFGSRCEAVHDDIDDPAEERWASEPDKHPDLRSYLAWMFRVLDPEKLETLYQDLIEDCPPPILTVLEGRD